MTGSTRVMSFYPMTNQQDGISKKEQPTMPQQIDGFELLSDLRRVLAKHGISHVLTRCDEVHLYSTNSSVIVSFAELRNNVFQDLWVRNIHGIYGPVGPEKQV